MFQLLCMHAEIENISVMQYDVTQTYFKWAIWPPHFTRGGNAYPM